MALLLTVATLVATTDGNMPNALELWADSAIMVWELAAALNMLTEAMPKWRVSLPHMIALMHIGSTQFLVVEV